MAEQTTNVESLDREVAADRLNDIASTLRNGGQASIRVGNKNITLNPPETVNYNINVTERQKMFRGRRETVKIELDWRPQSGD